MTQTVTGIDFKINTINLDGKNVKVQIWDTAGQERFRTITQTYYRGAQGVILTFDTTNKESFENVRNWVRQVDVHAQPNVQKILLGNKCDLLEQREVTKEQAEKVAEQYKMKYFETSAKTGQGIKDGFETVASQIIKNIDAQKSATQ